MSFHEQYDFSLLVNEKERWVIDELELQLTGKEEICQCSECVLDMVAYALNSTKPIYRVTLLGAIYARVEDDAAKKEIQDSVTAAIEKITKNPSHSKNKS